MMIPMGAIIQMPFSMSQRRKTFPHSGLAPVLLSMIRMFIAIFPRVAPCVVTIAIS